MKNFNINIQDCKPEELQLVLSVLGEAIKDKRADLIFWDDINGPTKIKIFRWPSNRRIQLTFTENESEQPGN